MKNITDYIISFNDVLDKKICNEIIEKSNFDTFTSATVGDDKVIKDYRKCYQKKLDDKFNDNIYEVIGTILKKYKDIHSSFTTGLTTEDTGYIHLLYKGDQKGEYKEHVDHADQFPRVLSCSIILNDDYDGGNFAFFNKEYIVEKKAGSVVVFPSNFCFPHSITPVSKGDRHSIITWIG
jgi:predicted 2-oxoglutarate/Fe(II)-dependent dioxygenase YbiX